MTRNGRKGILALLAFSVAIVGCMEEATPSRDHIPVLKERLYQLQVAVADRNRAAIDSLLSVDILSQGQNSDSLLLFVYGQDEAYAFTRFGNYQIIYTDDKARIDCYVMDSLGDTSRPIILTLVNQHDLWLLKRFEVRSSDSLESL